MQKRVFKIFDGRTQFWQWDTKQKLIVLDDSVTEVHFSNKGMKHSLARNVYEYEGVRICNVPDVVLQLPHNLVAYAYSEDHTIKSVKFAVIKRPIPDGYVVDQSEEFNEIERRLELLEAVLKDIEMGKQEMHKFYSVEEAQAWAKETQSAGSIVVVRIDGKWIAHVVEDDYSVTPICNNKGEMVEVSILDGGDGDGYNAEEIVEVYYWDGGSATGIDG